MAEKKKETSVIRIEPGKTKILIARIKGISPLIMHRPSEKTKEKIAAKRAGEAVQKENIIPEEEIESSIYWIEKDRRMGFPVGGFKQAMVRAATQFNFKMVDVRQAFFVLGEASTCPNQEGQIYVHIEGDGPHCRYDQVRLPSGGLDIRYRAYVKDWSAELKIQFKDGLVSVQELIHILNAAGFSVGVGDWRPACKGDFGRFEVVNQ
jgi:hypothetical protein